VDWERISNILLNAQDRLRAAMLRGAADLPAGLEAWDRAVRSHNEWTAAASHALHAERRATEALDALAAWMAGHPQSTDTHDFPATQPALAAHDAADAA
jgi:hypothetical protein